ncbi:MAG: TetR/AcrR family transcriptional regulator [Campylobacteraceae bacterium]|nr:TetR/AcrR family transcriptional regulator [Campylobacteraceae bacterium]
MPRVKLFDENEILKKSMELFWKKGYSATSVQDMVNHLGINRGSMYDTFGDKKNLFNKSLSLYCSTNQEALSEFFKHEKSVKYGLKKLFGVFIADSISDRDQKGCFVVNTTTELNPDDEEINKVLLQNKEVLEKMFYDFLKQGQDRGEISKDKDIEAISSLIYTLFSGIRVVARLESNDKKLLSSMNAVLSILD